MVTVPCAGWEDGRIKGHSRNTCLVSLDWSATHRPEGTNMRSICTLGTAIAITSSFAAADIELDITASIGTGSQTAYSVIDFEATGGGSFAFAYSWDGDASVHDMLLALEEVGLAYEWTDWGFGIFADNFMWQDFAGDMDLYWAHSLSTVIGDETTWSDAWSSADQEVLVDGMISGWYNGFNEDFSAIPPSLPLAAIPGPSTVALLLICAHTRRRRQPRRI